MKTRFDDFAVEQHRAGAAFANDAADVGSGETEIFAEKMREKNSRLDVLLVNRIVCFMFYEYLGASDGSTCAFESFGGSAADEHFDQLELVLRRAAVVVGGLALT